MTPRVPLRKDCLPVSFYAQPTEQVARALIGKSFLHRVEGNWIGGTIVETEAYLASDDPASHSSRGKTKSNGVMFGKPGLMYVYPIHAKYCLNFVTESEGRGTAVLIRAIEPIWGIPEMQKARNQTELRRLTRGPAMLCQAMGVDRSHNGIDLVKAKDFRVAAGSGLNSTGFGDSSNDPEIVSSKRIGISKAVDRLLRFTAKESRFLSR